MSDEKNVLGSRLEPCSVAPRTGFYRGGCCNTWAAALRIHIGGRQMTAAFLSHPRESGNDLSTPVREAGFPGLKPGDRWCVCAGRWREAFEAGVAPPVVLSATHEETLAVVPLEALKRHALDVH